MSDVGDVVIVCGLGHLRKRRRSNPKIPLVVFAAEFDRKGPKKEGREGGSGREEETTGEGTCPLGMQRGGLFLHLLRQLS